MFISGSLQTLLSGVVLMLEIGVYALLGYWTVLYFDLQVDWGKKNISSKTGDTVAFIFNLFNVQHDSSLWISALQHSRILILTGF